MPPHNIRRTIYLRKQTTSGIVDFKVLAIHKTYSIRLFVLIQVKIVVRNTNMWNKGNTRQIQLKWNLKFKIREKMFASGFQLGIRGGQLEVEWSTSHNIANVTGVTVWVYLDRPCSDLDTGQSARRIGVRTRTWSVSMLCSDPQVNLSFSFVSRIPRHLIYVITVQTANSQYSWLSHIRVQTGWQSFV